MSDQMMKLGWHKCSSLDPGQRSSPEKRRNSTSLSMQSSISREYEAAIRTKSYAELWSKAQSQLIRLSTSISPVTSLSTRNLLISHLSETLLEPGREILEGIIESLHLDKLLVEYFDASSGACDVCELLLVGVRQTRLNYKKIWRVIGLSRGAYDCSSYYTDRESQLTSQELGAYSSLGNPLSLLVSPVEFHDMNKSYMILLNELIQKREQIKRKARLTKLSERAGSCCLAVAIRVMRLASVMLVTHGAITAKAAPGMISSCFSLGHSPNKKKKPIGDINSPSLSTWPCPNPKKWKLNYNSRRCSNERLRSQLDEAAKGVHVLINDMGTMGSLVGRLQDEVDQAREWADMGAKNSKSYEILKEVAKELDMSSVCFMERLEELEEHIYLCLLAINQTRRSLLQEIRSSPDKTKGEEDDIC